MPNFADLGFEMASASTLVIDYGDLPSLVAVALQRDPLQMVLWHPSYATDASEKLLEAAKEHGEVFGIQTVFMSKRRNELSSSHKHALALKEADLLLAALIAATESGCQKVVWPKQVGPDPKQICIAVERANLVVALAETGQTASSLMIDLPLVDLSEKQIVDLGDNQGMLDQSFWPCEGGQKAPCGKCIDCRRWAKGFESAGQPWPWAAVAV